MPKKRLIDIPTDQHPFNWTRYSAVVDEIDDGIDRMRAIGYPEISHQLLEARYRLKAAWELIQLTERAEQAEQDAQAPE